MTTTEQTATLPEAGINRTETPVPGPYREQMIRKGVLAELGQPTRLLKVAVLPLWGDNFRVNVWTGEGAVGIPNSYFITADERGGILRSDPPIQRQY